MGADAPAPILQLASSRTAERICDMPACFIEP